MDNRDDQGSLIQRPRAYSDIIKLEDPRILEEFLDEPATFIAETITGALATGKFGVMAAGGRIVQALLKGQHFKQWAKEFRTLREKGKIPDDFAEKKYGFQTWVELMTVIDEDAPDADRLEALKAVFYAVNAVGVEEKDRIQAYQLWRIAKQLNSGDLLLLKALNEKEHMIGGNSSTTQWTEQLASASGFGIGGLVSLHVSRLAELHLMSTSTISNPTITVLGRRLCSNIQTYCIDLEQAEGKG